MKGVIIPVSAICFGLGLSSMYLALAYDFRFLILSASGAKVIALAQGILGVLTLVLGLSWVTATFSPLDAVIGKVIRGKIST